MLIQGFFIGFAAAATLGPIALLIIQRAMKDGWQIGLASEWVLPWPMGFTAWLAR